jgi:hypothetical protein
VKNKLKSNNPKILTKMNTCLHSLFVYFENVLHPASGWMENKGEKKRRSQKMSNASTQPSPECFNMRASAKKQDKVRRNPAP